MFTFVIVAPPEPTLKYYNHTIQLNQPIILNYSVSAVPHPEFQWILETTNESLPDLSWNSTYTNKTTTSTLNYTFGTADLNENCTICVVCIARNHYGRSEHRFTLSLNSSEDDCSLPTYSSTSDTNVQVLSNSGSDTHVQVENNSGSDTHVQVVTVGVSIVLLLVALLIAVSAVMICKRR